MFVHACELKRSSRLTSRIFFNSALICTLTRCSLLRGTRLLLSKSCDHLTIRMAARVVRNTVDRLDRPSTYGANKNKRRRFNNNRDGGDEGERDHERDKEPTQEEKLKDSTTLYVGNLSFYTTEEQIHELFSKCGDIKRLVMGLDRFQKTPCGFCFVEYYTHQDALDCMKYIGGTKLDERVIRTDLDEGFVEGRQYGRGKSGGQVRDEYRSEYDPGRGGYGKAYAEEFGTDLA